MPDTAKKKKGRHGNEKIDVKELFKIWCSTPDADRIPLTQGEFAKEHKVNEATLYRWKQDDEFWDDVQKLTRKWFRSRVPAVLKALANNAERHGDSPEVKLVVQYAEGWKEATETSDPAAASAIEGVRTTLKSLIEAVKKADK